MTGSPLLLLDPADDRVPQKAGTAGQLLVIIGGKAFVQHIKFREVVGSVNSFAQIGLQALV